MSAPWTPFNPDGQSRSPASRRSGDEASSRSLGIRLDALLGVIRGAQQNERYDWVWDLCCDHGYLGLRLLREELCRKVVFVDRVPHIMAALAARLQAWPGPGHALLTCDAANLRPPSDTSHLLVIAGLGGEQIAALIAALHQGNGGHPGDYLLCPANNPFELRTLLGQLDLRLCSEAIVAEKGRQYEVIHVRRPLAGGPEDDPVTPVGAMWNPDDNNHRLHRERLLRHYRHRSRGETDGRSLAIAALYDACLTRAAAIPPSSARSSRHTRGSNGPN